MNEKLYVEAQGFSQDDLESLVIALKMMRDSQGLLLALDPVDVFQPWFLKLAKPKLSDDAPDFVKETNDRIWGKHE